MFGFLLQRDRDKVRQVLSKHMNRDFLKKFRYGKRVDARGGFCQPVWIVPIDEADTPQFDAAFAVITKDISPEGLSLIHTAQLDATKVLVAFEAGDEFEFVHCTHQHSTPIGLGFHQIGLQPQWVERVKPADAARLGAVLC